MYYSYGTVEPIHLFIHVIYFIIFMHLPYVNAVIFYGYKVGVNGFYSLHRAREVWYK